MTTDLTPTKQLALTAALTMALLLSACSSDDEIQVTGNGDEAAAAADDTASTADAPGLAPSDLQGDEWASEVIDTWASFQQARTDNAAVAVQAMTTDSPRFEWTQDLLLAERDAVDVAVESMPGVPDDESLAGPYRDLIAALVGLGDAAADGHELGTGDPVGLAAELEEVGDDLPAAEYGQAYIAFVEADEPLSAACFALQERMAEAGHGVLDCAGSQTDTGQAGAAAAPDDPTATPTGLVTAVLEPGIHDFTVFEPGLRLETTEPVGVITAAESILFEDLETPAIFEIASVTRFAADPASTGEPDPGLMSWIELPDDIGSWLAELPIEITGTGTMPIAGVEAAYWDLAPSGEFPGPVQLAIYNGQPDGETFSGIVLVPGDIEYLRLIEWQRETDRLLIAVYVTDASVDYEAFVVEVLSGVR